MAGVLSRAAAPLSRHLGAAAAAPLSRHLVAAAAAPLSRTTSSAATALRPATRFTSAGAAFRRHHHSESSQEAIRKLEERLARLEETDPLVRKSSQEAIRKLEERLARLEETDPLVRKIVDRVSVLESGTARFKVQMENKIVSVELKVEKESLDRFHKVRLAQVNLHRHIGSLEKKLSDLETASAKRDVEVEKYEVQSLITVKQAAWKVAFTILFGGTTVAFGVINLVTSQSKNQHIEDADSLIRSRTAELENMFKEKLQVTVQQEVATALANEALKRSGGGGGSGGAGGGGTGGGPNT